MGEGRRATQRSEDRRRVIVGLVPAMLVPFLASLVYFVLLPGGVWTRMVYTAAKAFTVFWPVVARVTIEGVCVRRRNPDWRKHLSAIPAGVVTGSVIAALLLGAYAWTPLGDYVRRFAAPIGAKAAQLGVAEPLHYVVFSIFLAGAHSLIEEYFWRWYVFGRLLMVTARGIAYVLAGLSFAAHHYVLLGVYFPAEAAFIFGTAVGVGGVFWCWMYRRQETLAGVWVSHACVDIAICYVGYRLVFV